MKTISYFYGTVVEQFNVGKRLVSIAKRNRINDLTGIGFKIDSSNIEALQTRYFHKEIIEKSVEDPFGEIDKSVVTRYDVTALSTLNEPNVLHVMNPGRKFRRAIQLIEKGADSLVRMTPNFEMLFEKFEGNSDEFVVRMIETNNFVIRGRTTSKVFFSSSVDVREDVKYFLGKRTFSIAKLKFDYLCQGSLIKCEVSQTGKIVTNLDFSAEPHEDFTGKLFSAMTLQG